MSPFENSPEDGKTGSFDFPIIFSSRLTGKLTHYQTRVVYQLEIWPQRATEKQGTTE
ncbi:MAG: hypothetical protein Q8941_05430 [Bacteroidota bacterium]|nr:hypothetical protein [Bacteroidota bacterium]